jgi:hypothetical protein
MKLHANSSLGPNGRAIMVRRVVHKHWSLTQAAEATGVSEATARKLVERSGAEGLIGLLDRSSGPGRSPTAPMSGGPRRSLSCAGGG